MSNPAMVGKIREILKNGEKKYCGYMPPAEEEYCGQDYCAMGQQFAHKVKKMSPRSKQQTVTKKANQLAKTHPSKLYAFLDGYAKEHTNNDSDEEDSDSSSTDSDDDEALIAKIDNFLETAEEVVPYSHRRTISDKQLLHKIDNYLAKTKPYAKTKSYSHKTTMSDEELLSKIDAHLAKSQPYSHSKKSSPKKQGYWSKVFFGRKN